jgi:hypothetical protein
MITTEQKGPYYIERHDNAIIVVRSNIEYNAVLITSHEVRPLKKMKNGKTNMTESVLLKSGEKIMLHAEGHEDVIVQAEGEGGQG